MIGAKTLLGMVVIVGALCSCSKPSAPSPIAGIVKEFEDSRKPGLNGYGLSTVQSREQNIGAVDCLVFNEAAKKPMPNSLGGLSAFSDAMYYRVVFGCEKTQQALTDYETTRRVLGQMWANQIQQLPYTSQILLQEHPVGVLVKGRVDQVVSEQSVCLSSLAMASRQSRSSKTLRQILQTCSTNSAGRNDQEQCNNAIMVSFVQSSAQGPRDELAWVSELASRWRAALNVCNTTAPQAYVQFHNTVPRSVFAGPGYRFAVAADPVLRCSMQQVVDKRSKQRPARPAREWVECGNRLYPDMGRAFSFDYPPHVFTQQIITGQDRNQWMYNPKEATKYPELWSFGECEKGVVSTLSQNGLNILSPYALKNYCKRAARSTAKQNSQVQKS